MEFAIIAEMFQKMEETTKRIELTDILVELLKKTPKKLIPNIVYLIQGIIRPNFEGVELGIAEKLAIRAISKSIGLPVKKIEDDYEEGGDLGITASNMLKLKTQTTFTKEKITVERVYETLFKISKLEGKGSQDLKMKYISSLLNDATPVEAKFVLKILLGTLRLGIAENTVMDALAIGFTGKKENREHIESAYNVSSDLGKVSLIVATDGIDDIKKFKASQYRGEIDILTGGAPCQPFSQIGKRKGLMDMLDRLKAKGPRIKPKKKPKKSPKKGFGLKAIEDKS